MTMPAVPAAVQPTIRYEPRGGALQLMLSRDPEVLMDGPANTGKSYAGLWKMHIAAVKYPGMHGLLLRKTLVSLKASTLVTYRERILGPNSPVRYWSAKADEPAHYAYPNGSKLYVGGMDNAAKVMSTEYDMVFWDEATDGDVSEWEALGTRMRYGRMPYQQQIGACNPGPPTHWLNQRCNENRTTRIISRHEDNPTVTPQYLRRLDELTGVRRLRLYLGIWAAAEGMVYQDSWEPAVNLVPRTPFEQRDPKTGRWHLPLDWPRFLSVDFGYTHPFVCQWWAIDPDGRLLLYREIYQTSRLVEDHAKTIKEVSRFGQPGGDPLPRAIYCDHDAEDRFTLERHLGMYTTPAHKTVRDGIQAVASRLRPAGDNRPRLYVLRDSLVERDPILVDQKSPTCTAEEFESYVWAKSADGSYREEPVKQHDHGMDALRYMVAALDVAPRGVTRGPKLF